MTWVLFNRHQQGVPSVIRRYQTHRAALIGMRASNRNAGWTRISRAYNGICEMEWAAKSNGLPIYDYAPYVIAHQHSYEEKYSLNEMVSVTNLMSGARVNIPRKDQGTALDPSQERYWSR